MKKGIGVGKDIKKEISPFFTFEELSKFDGIW